MGRLYLVIGIVAVVVIAIVAFNSGTGGVGSAMATTPVQLGELGDQEVVQQAQGVQIGESSAPITVLEFGDYQCPGCAAFAAQVKPLIEQEYVQDGTVRFVFHDNPIPAIHPNAFLAARAARCAEDQDRYWAYHDALFANQSRWSPSNNAASLFIDYAEELGLDADPFRSCLRSDAHAELVTANMMLGERLGVPGTPTVFVGAGPMPEMVRSPNNWENVRSAIERAKAQLGMEADTATASGAQQSGPVGPVRRQ
jgi:protein-disulfide isomerase